MKTCFQMTEQHGVTQRLNRCLAVFPIEIEGIDGTNIVSGDYCLIRPTNEIEIELSGRIKCSEGTLTIADLGKFVPDGSIIFFDMVARG
jgi:hypothetical protein